MPQPSLFTQQPQGVTLSEFNARIEAHLNGKADIQNQWVIAETSDLRLNRSGHCYTELIEKDSRVRPLPGWGRPSGPIPTGTCITSS